MAKYANNFHCPVHTCTKIEHRIVLVVVENYEIRMFLVCRRSDARFLCNSRALWFFVPTNHRSQHRFNQLWACFSRSLNGLASVTPVAFLQFYFGFER